MTKSRFFLAAAGAGLTLGVALFAVEGALVLRDSAIGFDFDVEGPYAALFEPVRRTLPGILARVALAYAAGGIALGLVSALVVRILGVRRAWAAMMVWCAAWATFAAALAWDRAIVRPALFDDLGAFLPLLERIVESGEPWHPRAFAAAALAMVIAFGIWIRVRSKTSLASDAGFFASAAALCGLAVFAWAPTLARVPRPAVASRPARADAPPRPPLVVLIGIDAFRPDRLRALGGTRDIAPNVEAFLSEATLFTNAWTPIAQTEPAWRSLLTARWPDRTGVRYPLTAVRRWVGAPTFAGTLTDAGWRTTFATDCSRFNWQPESSGFARRHQPPRGSINFVLEKMRFRALGVIGDNMVGAALVPELLNNRAIAGIHDPAGYAGRLGAALRDSATSGPALFAFHSTAAHFPGDPVHPFHQLYVREDAPFERRLRMFFSPIAENEGGAAAAPAPHAREDSEALYDELLAQADAQVGELFDELRRVGRYDDATIVLFSDHGESFHADHPELAGASPVHGARLSDEENRILLAVKPPRSREARRVDALVRLIDIGPTVLDLVGAPALPEADGVSLRPLIEGRSMPPLFLYAETGFTHASPSAFDRGHAALASRAFESYSVLPDGVVEMSDAAHEAVLGEKDVGAFDGARWIIRSPRADGSTEERPPALGPSDPLACWLRARLVGASPPASTACEVQAGSTVARPHGPG